MLRYAIDQGVNYVDTAYPYHSGQSEIFVGKVLKDGYRDKVRLATKMPCWLVKSTDDFDRYLDEQLVKLQTDHIDFYLLHGLNQTRWDEMQQLDVLSWAEKAMGDGRFRIWVFHSMMTTIHSNQLSMGMVVGRFARSNTTIWISRTRPGPEAYGYAASKGLAVVIMEPILGGRIVNPPNAVKTTWDRPTVDARRQIGLYNGYGTNLKSRSF